MYTLHNDSARVRTIRKSRKLEGVEKAENEFTNWG